MKKSKNLITKLNELNEIYQAKFNFFETDTFIANNKIKNPTYKKKYLLTIERDYFKEYPFNGGLPINEFDTLTDFYEWIDKIKEVN